MFAWSHKDMLGIDPEIAQHHIDTHDHMLPIKQKLRRMRTEWLLKIKEEVIKQLKEGSSNLYTKPNGSPMLCLYLRRMGM